MDERTILERIHALVAEEQDLRQKVEDRSIRPEDEQARLTQLETALDQCWDLLRQRRARQEAGEDPDAARVRPPDEVEGYLQ